MPIWLGISDFFFFHIYHFSINFCFRDLCRRGNFLPSKRVIFLVTKAGPQNHSLLLQHRRVIIKYSQFKKNHFFHFELFFSSKSSFWVTIIRLQALGSVLTKIFKKSQNYCVKKPSQKLKENIQLLSWCLGNAPCRPHKTRVTRNVSSNTQLLKLLFVCGWPASFKLNPHLQKLRGVLFGVWMLVYLSIWAQVKQFSDMSNYSSFAVNRDCCTIESYE